MSESQHREATRMSQQTSFKHFGGSAPENYERFFVPAIPAPLATELIDIAALRPGERVLDVACGTGVVARLAAERVGATGTVAGIDLNPGMLAVARSVTPPGMVIEWHQSSAEAMPLPDEAFDVVLCKMGIQFVPDKLAALREMQRVLAPGGRLIINVVGPKPRVFAILAEALAHHIKPEIGAFVDLVFSEVRQESFKDHSFGGYAGVCFVPIVASEPGKARPRSRGAGRCSTATTPTSWPRRRCRRPSGLMSTTSW
jgi:SAM-dependent methyltransferase